MHVDKNDRIILINYRLEQAKGTIKEVQTIIDNNLLNVAVNRIYYGINYSLTALALKYEFQTSKHLQLIGWFNKTFIKKNIISKKYGKILRDSYKNRSDGDYVPYIDFKREEVIEMFE